MISKREAAAILRHLVERNGLYEFVQKFWRVVEPGCAFVPNWHLEEMCEALSWVSLRTRPGGDRWPSPRLVINVPPGTGKSLITSVFWPAWHWTWDPGHKWLFTSYDRKLVNRDAERFARIVESDLYKLAWPVKFRKKGGTLSYGELHNYAGGLRLSVQLGGGITGWHGHTLVVDDPIKPTEAEATSKVVLEKTTNTWRNVAATRRADADSHAVVLIMQRLNHDDLAGEELRGLRGDGSDGADHLCRPMRYVPDCEWDHGNSIGLKDPRTQPGELLFPARFSERAVQDLERALGTPQNISAQLQQNPVPQSGSIFEDGWIQTWTELPREWRLRFVQSWDLGFKGKSATPREACSRVHGVLFAWDERNVYLLDEAIGAWNYPETKRAFQAAQADPQWAKAECVLLENKANGPALIADLEESSQGLVIVPVEPDRSKEERAMRHSAFVQSGRFWVPRPQQMSSVAAYRAEIVRFPHQKRNDRVDTLTQALDYIRGQSGGLGAWANIGPA